MKKLFHLGFIALTVIIILPAHFVSAQGISISEIGAPPDNSAELDVISSSKGVLVPRMSNTQRDSIVNPAQGLLIYNISTHCYNYYDASQWYAICGNCIPPASPTLSSNSPICQGSTLTLSASSISGATYNWTGPNGFTSSSQNPSISSATAVATGTYTVTATVNGCSTTPATVSATVYSLPDATFTYSPNPAPPNTSITFSPNLNGATSYNWTFQSGTPSSSTVQNPSVTWSSSSTYAVTLNITNNGCSASSTSNIVVNNPQKTVFIISGFLSSADVGGLTGADAICQSKASAAGLTGTYMAWLSDGTNSPSTRFTHAGPYVMTTGTVIATSWADLTDGTIGNNGIDRDEYGNLTINTGVISNTTTSGTILSTDPNSTCSFWTSTSGSLSNQGSPGGSNSFGFCCGTSCWTDGCSSAACNNSTFWKLYCFQQ